MSDDLIVGIDLGTTNSAVAIVQNGQPRLLSRGGDKLLPSVVGYTPDGQWLIGRPALNQYTLHPEQTVRSIKRKMGTSETVTLGGEDFTPEAISAFILRELKAIAEENLGQPVTKAVITVPAYFTDAQRRATRTAGEIAGLEVVRIINEPTAAALAYGMHHTTDQTALVYDLGGGTFDVSLVEMMDGIVEVQASHGDTHLGGDDFDRLLADHARAIFNETHQFSLAENRLAMARLTAAAEAAKIQLSSVVETPIREEYLAERGGVSLHLDTILARSDFEQLVTPLVERTLRSIEQVLADAELEPDEVDRVLFVGGSTRMPLVWDIVASYTGLEPEVEINPDEAVALGAAIQAAIIAGQPIDAILVDVTPYSLGIETAIPMGGQIIPDVYEVLIHRNTTIPVTSEKIFATLHPDQDAIHLKVYQGEQPQASSNVLLGDFMVEDLESAEPGRLPTVTVRFDFDVDGLLHVRATDRATGKHHSISVEAAQSRMSPQDIAQARTTLPGIEVIPASEHPLPLIDVETQALLDRAETLLESNKLTLDQTASLQTLVADIKTAPNQEVFDDLAEALLELLFELE